MATLEDNTALLLYRVGPVLCAAPCLAVRAIIEPPTLTRPPGSDRGHPGIFRHANTVVSSLDLRYKFGVDEVDWAQPGRTIVTQLEKGHVGFYVDEILDVISWPASGWGSLPALLPRGIFSRTLLINEQIFLYADFKDLQRIPDNGYLRQYIQQLLAAKQPTTPAPPPPSEQASTTSKTPAQQTPRSPEQSSVQAPEASRSRAGAKLDVATSSRPPSPSPQRSLPKKIVKRPATASPHKQPDSPRVPPRQATARTKPTTQITAATTIHPHQPNNSTSAGVVESATHIPSSPYNVMTPNTIRPTPASSIAASNATNSRTKTAAGRTGHETTRHTDYTHPLLYAFTLLLLFSIIGFGIWYMFPQNTQQTSQQTATTSTPVVPNITAAATQDSTASAGENPARAATQLESTKPEAVSNTHIEPATPQSQPVTSTESHTTTATQDTSSPAADNKPATDPNAYHASIKQDAQGLTITLEAPADDPVFTQAPPPPSQEKTNTSVATTTNDTTLKAANAHPPATKTLSISKSDEVITTSAQTVEIIHIVVKGDTLWDIAKRYVKNPFRYPELARLSKIKNPDLIYPGNRVRIIKRKRQP